MVILLNMRESKKENEKEEVEEEREYSVYVNPLQLDLAV